MTSQNAPNPTHFYFSGVKFGDFSRKISDFPDFLTRVSQIRSSEFHQIDLISVEFWRIWVCHGVNGQSIRQLIEPQVIDRSINCQLIDRLIDPTINSYRTLEKRVFFYTENNTIFQCIFKV